MTTKICTKCNTEKELILFCRKQSSKDKLRSECKSCEKDYRSRNKDKIIKNKKIYYQENKNKLLEISCKYQTEYRKNNAEKLKEYNLKYKQTNKQKIKDNHSRYMQTAEGKASKRNSNHKRRALIKKSNILGKDIIELKIKQNNRCYWCSTSIAKTYQIDHYIPLSKGGEHLIDNIVLACPHCNMSKHDKDPIDFANKLGRLL